MDVLFSLKTPPVPRAIPSNRFESGFSVQRGGSEGKKEISHQGTRIKR